jgi:hypothetical protein
VHRDKGVGSVWAEEKGMLALHKCFGWRVMNEHAKHVQLGMQKQGYHVQRASVRSVESSNRRVSSDAWRPTSNKQVARRGRDGHGHRCKHREAQCRTCHRHLDLMNMCDVRACALQCTVNET